MHGLRSLAMAGLLATGLASAQTKAPQCAQGVMVFVARGTGEALQDRLSLDKNLVKDTGLGNDTVGLGESGKLLKPVFDKIPGSNHTGIPYPASNGLSTNNEPNYFESVVNGTEQVREIMTEYAKACPNGKMAWIGYSQGAQIISNSLCGMPVIWAQFSSYPGLANKLSLTQPLPANVTKNVIVTLLLGDPSHKNGTDYAYGSYNMTGDGVFFRDDSSACDAMGKRIRSYCDSGDPYCDVGPIVNATTHTTYVKRRKDELVNYIVEQWNNGGDTGDASSSTRSSPSPSSTSEDAGSDASALAKSSGSIAVLALVSLLFI